jgi:hypothetical protein
LQTISDFISTLIRKGVDKSEIKNFLLVEDKDGNSFVHLLGDRKITAVDLSKIFNNLFKFDKNIIERLLLHKNNDSRTFYSHYYHYHSNGDKTELGNFLKDILLGLDETKQIEIENDFPLIEKLALKDIFKQFEVNYYFLPTVKNIASSFRSKPKIKSGIVFELNIFQQTGDKYKFCNTTFLDYFAFRTLNDYLIKNFRDKASAIALSKILNKRKQFPEICFLLELFFMDQIKQNEKLIIDFLGLEIEKEIDHLLNLLFDILISHLKRKGEPEVVKKTLLARDDRNGEKKSFLHLLVLKKNKDLIENIFDKLKQIKIYLNDPETFKELFLIKENKNNFYFLNSVGDSNVFRTAIEFIQSEMEYHQEILNEILFYGSSSGSTKFMITNNINNFINALEVLGRSFDRNLMKQFLMQKNSHNQSFLLCYDDYSNPENCNHLMRFLDSLKTIFGKDFLLFNDLFYAKDNKGNYFFKKLTDKYKNYKENFKTIENFIRDMNCEVDPIFSDRFFFLKPVRAESFEV